MHTALDRRPRTRRHRPSSTNRSSTSSSAAPSSTSAAARHGAARRHRRPARPVPRAARPMARSRRPSSPRAPRRTSATSANGCNAQAASGYVSYDAQTGRYSMTPEQALAVRAGGQPGVHRRRVPDVDRSPGGWRSRLTESVPHRRRHRLARASTTSCSTASSGSSARRYHRQSRPGVDPGPRRRRSEAARRRAASPTSAAATAPRRSSWREAFPKSQFIGFDYHPESIAAANARARSAGVADRLPVRGRERQGLPGARLRSRDGVRRAARHGRSGGRVAARADDARAGRSLDDRRAVRGRSRRGEPEPGRPRVLRGLDADVHAVLAGAGGRDSRSAPRRARPGCARWCRAPASRRSVAPCSRRSTSCSRRIP